MPFTNTGSVEGTFSGVTSSSDTVSGVAVPALGAQRIGVVTVTMSATVGMTPTGVTWNGVAMSVGPAANNATTIQAELFYLIGCAHNGSYNIVVTYSASSVHNAHVTVTWADEANPIELDDVSDAIGTAQNPAITSTQAVPNALVISASASAANAITAGSVSGCTLLQDWDQGGNCHVAAYSTPAASGDTTHTHTYTQVEAYAMVSASFKATAAATVSLPARVNRPQVFASRKVR